MIVLLSAFLIVGQASAEYYDFAYGFDPPGTNVINFLTQLISNFLQGIACVTIIIAVAYVVAGFTGGYGFLVAPFILYIIFIDIPNKIGWRAGYISFCIGIIAGFIVLALWIIRKTRIKSITGKIKFSREKKPHKKKRCI